MELSVVQLGNILTKDREITVRRTLESLGMIPNTLSLTEAYRLAGRNAVDRAIRSGTLKRVKKGGRTSKIKIIRAEFDEWMLQNEISTVLLTESNN